MKTISRICALATALALTVSGSVYGATKYSDAAESKHEKAISVISGIGIMEGYSEDSFGAELNITRAEFADVMYNIYTYTDKKAETQSDGSNNSTQIDTSGFFTGGLFGDDSSTSTTPGFFGTQSSTTQQNVNARFTDVPSNHWAYEAIEKVCAYGTMIGTSDTTFEPERAILFEEAVAAVVSLTGYRIMAEYEGYPNGYINLAQELKLLRNIDYAEGANIKRAEVAQLIYNSLSVEILSSGILGLSHSYTTISGKTVLSELLGLKKVEGIVTANDITTLVGESNLAEGRVEINKEVYTLGENAKDTGEYIGRSVVIYATDSDDENTILYVEPSDDDNSIIIKAEDLLEFENGVLTYNENYRTKSIKITANIPIIYNGMAVSEVTGNPFDIQYGTAIIAKTNDEINAIIIRSYESLAVKIADTANKKVFCQNGKIIDFGDENLRFDIRDSKGNKIKADTIKVGNTIAYSQNGNNILMYVATTTAEGKVSSVGAETLKVGGTEYEISDEMRASSIMQGLKAGSSVRLYIDFFGGIAWYELMHQELLPAVLVKFVEDYDPESNLDRMVIKLVDLSGEEKPEGKKLYLADKAKVETADGVTRNLTSKNAVANLKTGFIKYTVNEVGEVNRIQIPLDKEGSVGRTFTVYENSNQYYSSGNYFGGIYGVDLKTKLVQVPKDPGDINDYSYLSAAKISNASYDVSVYQKGGDLAAEVILVSNGTFKQTDVLNSTTFYAAEKIEYEYDEDADRAVKRVWTTSATNERVVFISYPDYTDANGKECTAFDIASGLSGNKKYELSEGDIFFPQIKDHTTGEVSAITIIYKIDLKDPSGEEGYITAEMTDKYFVKNKYVNYEEGKHTVYESKLTTDDVLNIGNPYSTTGSTLAHVPSSYNTIFYGYLYDADLTPTTQEDSEPTWCTLFTTQDIRNSTYIPSGLPKVREYDESGEYTGIYLKRFINFRGYSKTVFTYSGTEKDFEIIRGGWLPREWARPYTTYGAACSKIICLPSFSIIINDGRTK